MCAVPQTKANDIINVLVGLQNRASSNRFRLKVCKRDAEAITVHNEEVGYTVQGMIACMEHDIAGMHKCHNLAINCSGRSVYSLINYGVSLTRSFLWNEAVPLYQEVFDKEPTNAEWLELLINAYFRVGYLSKSVQYIEVWEKMFPDKAFLGKEPLIRAHELMGNLPITEDDLNSVSKVLSRELSLTECLGHHYRLHSVSEGNHSFLSYEVEFKDPETNIFEIECLIDEVISEEIPENVLNNVSITFCVPHVDGLDSFEMADESPIFDIGNLIDFKKIEELVKDVEPLQ